MNYEAYMKFEQKDQRPCLLIYELQLYTGAADMIQERQWSI